MPAAEIKLGSLVGEFYTDTVDTSADNDFDPQIVGSTGTGTLVPSISNLTVTRADLSKYKILMLAVPFKIQGGHVVTPDGDPLKLVANVGQYPNVDVTGWNYTVGDLVIDGHRFSRFAVDIAANVNNDLANMIPAPPTPAAYTVVKGGVSPEQLSSTYIATADRGAARPPAAKVLWTGAGASPPNAIDDDLWLK